MPGRATGSLASEIFGSDDPPARGAGAERSDDGRRPIDAQASREVETTAAIRLAEQAQSSGDWSGALTHWREVADRLPKNETGVIGVAVALRQLGRQSESDAFISEATSRFPHSEGLAIAYALNAQSAGDGAEALRRWAGVRERFSNNSFAYAAAAAVLLEFGHADDAEALLAGVVSAFPDDVDVAVKYMNAAVARGDWAEAERRWNAVLAKFDGVQASIEQTAAALRAAHRLEESDRLLRRAIERWPDQIGLRLSYAVNAEVADDWPEAVRRWDAAHRLWPDEENIRNAHGTAIWRAGLVGGAPDASPSAPKTTAVEASRSEATKEAVDDLRGLAFSFEGLGDDCEFGVVQRQAGAEPIGLFRFAASGNVKNLIYLLENGLEALGDSAFTSLVELNNGEYAVQDARGYYLTHTFIRIDTVRADAILQQQLRRIEFLKRKLIEDLTAGEKIFVYKSTFSQLTEEDAIALHDALLRYGPNTLLGVSIEDDRRRAGSIEHPREGLMLGFVDKMMHLERAQGLSVNVWYDLLREARAVARGAAASVAAEAR